MHERLEITPTQDFLLHYYSNFYHEAATRLGHRLMYDAYEIPIKELPIGGNDGLSKIVNFLPEITKTYEKSNFYSQLSADFNPKLITDADEDLFSLYLSGYLQKLTSEKNPTKTLLTNHAVLTLSYLVKNRRVNYRTLNFEKNEFNFCDDDSVWLEKLTPDVVGNTLEEIKNSTNSMLCTPRGVLFQNELRAAHFFAAGYKIMKGLFPNSGNLEVNEEHFLKN